VIPPPCPAVRLRWGRIGPGETALLRFVSTPPAEAVAGLLTLLPGDRPPAEWTDDRLVEPAGGP
jgi:hypothetical protein